MLNCCFCSNSERWITNIRGVFLYTEWVKPHPLCCTLLNCACIQAVPTSECVLRVCLCVEYNLFCSMIVLMHSPTKPLTSKTQKTSHYLTSELLWNWCMMPDCRCEGTKSNIWHFQASNTTEVLILTSVIRSSSNNYDVMFICRKALISVSLFSSKFNVLKHMIWVMVYVYIAGL